MPPKPNPATVMPIPRALVWALAWGAMMSLSAVWSLLVDFDRAIDRQFVILAAVYFAGAFAAFLPIGAIALPRWARWPRAWRFVAIVGTLAAMTFLFTTMALNIEYRIHYPDRNDFAFSFRWLERQFYAAAGPTYQYAVIGTRHYLPLGPIFLLLASWRLSRLPR